SFSQQRLVALDALRIVPAAKGAAQIQRRKRALGHTAGPRGETVRNAVRAELFRRQQLHGHGFSFRGSPRSGGLSTVHSWMALANSGTLSGVSLGTWSWTRPWLRAGKL